MWKYVSRRIRDTFEKTYNVLDIKRTWTCSNGNHNSSTSTVENTDYNKKNNNIVCYLDSNYFKKNGPECNHKSSNGNDEKFKEKVRARHGHFNNTLIGALTWSSAIICGWYTSQLLCFHRRRLGWDTKCYYSKYFYNPGRAIHQNVLSHRALNAPQPPPSYIAHQKFNYFQEQQYDEYELKNIINEHFNETQENISEKPKDESKTIDSAVRDLINVLGDIEFELGVENIKAGHFKTAVSHLKLATSHNHPGATFNLGLCYEQGLGVERDLKLAQECYQIASAMGHPKAMYNLGIFYIQGLGGLKKNKHAARACFNAAANLGQQEAKFALGLKKIKSPKPVGESLPKLKSESVPTQEKSSGIYSSGNMLQSIPCT